MGARERLDESGFMNQLKSDPRHLHHDLSMFIQHEQVLNGPVPGRYGYGLAGPILRVQD